MAVEEKVQLERVLPVVKESPSADRPPLHRIALDTLVEIVHERVDIISAVFGSRGIYAWPPAVIVFCV